MATDGVWEELCYQILPFVSEHKLGLIGLGNSSTIVVVSLLVSVVVDQDQRLQNQDAKASI